MRRRGARSPCARTRTRSCSRCCTTQHSRLLSCSSCCQGMHLLQLQTQCKRRSCCDFRAALLTFAEPNTLGYTKRGVLAVVHVYLLAVHVGRVLAGVCERGAARHGASLCTERRLASSYMLARWWVANCSVLCRHCTQGARASPWHLMVEVRLCLRLMAPGGKHRGDHSAA